MSSVRPCRMSSVTVDPVEFLRWLYEFWRDRTSIGGGAIVDAESGPDPRCVRKAALGGVAAEACCVDGELDLLLAEEGEGFRFCF